MASRVKVKVKQHSYGFDLEFTLVEDDADDIDDCTPVNLTGLTVTARAWSNSTNVLNKACVHVDAPNGKTRLSVADGDLDMDTGIYHGELIISDGTRMEPTETFDFLVLKTTIT